MEPKKELLLPYCVAGILLFVSVVCYAGFSKEAPAEPERSMFQSVAGKVLFTHKAHTSESGYSIACADCHHHPEDEDENTDESSDESSDENVDENADESSDENADESSDESSDENADENADENEDENVDENADAENEDSFLGCAECHVMPKDGTMAEACLECHEPDEFDDLSSVLKKSDALHEQCIGCHKEEDAGPQECAQCHVTYSF